MNREQKFLFGIAIALVIGLGISTVYRSGPHTIFNHSWGSITHRTDFTVYQEAGRAVLDKTNIYEAHNQRGWYYMYLPVVAVAMLPFALLNVFWASLLWYLLSVAAVVHGIWLSVRLARRFWPNCRIADHWIGALVALLILLPTMSGLTRGQASVFLTYCILAGVWFYMRQRTWLAGLCFAGGVVLKVFPVLLLLYFLAKRRWKMATTMSVWLLVLVLVVPSAVFGGRSNYKLLRQWVTTVALPANQPDPAMSNIRYKDMIDPHIPRNQSVQAVIIRCFAGSTATNTEPRHELCARHLALGINLGLLIVSAIACARGNGLPDQRKTLWQLCVIILAMLVVSPVAWSHNYSLLILPLTLAIAVAFTNEKSSFAYQVGIVCFAAGVIMSLVPVLLTFGVLLFASLVLWGVLVAGAITAETPRE